MSTYRINGIKYNPANWAALDATERAACNRFAAARERELNTITATAYTCQGGPFDGHQIELESTTSATAAMNVGAWCGRYELQGNKSAADRLVWVGNDGGQAINTHHHTTDQKKAGADVTGRGFDQLRDLLADLAEDPTERAEPAPTEDKPGRMVARYTIGRTVYTIEATAEAADRLRARIIKAKRWFSDKLIPAARPAQAPSEKPADPVPAAAPETTPEALPALVAAVAIGTAQAQAAETCAPGAADPRAYVAAAAVDLERLTSQFNYCATRRRNIEAGRRGELGALAYIVETLQRIAQQPGHSVDATEARKTLQRLAAELAADAQAMSDQAHQQCGETQAQTVRMRVQLLQILAAMGHACDAQGAADLADEAAELVTCDGPELVDAAAAAADTPAAGCDAIGADHTPTEAAPADYSGPLKTRAQADDCTAPRETLATGAADASATSNSSTATPTAAQFLADIPQGMARAAFNGTSFSPERRGDLHRNAYAEALAEDYAHFLQHAQKGGTIDKLPAEFARYRARLAGLMRAYLASQSRCMSSFIVGPANFPAARMNKRADIAHRRLGEYLDTRETARRAVVRNLRPDLRPIMSGDADAADRLAAELAAAERWQETMKQANAAIRKHAKDGAAAQVAALLDLGITEEKAARLVTPPQHLSMYGQGFPSFKLTNNGANIRRMRQRLEMIERNKAAEVTEATGADGVRIEDDPPENRVRLFFPDKPAASVRDALKSAGYRWAPSIGAWQAYRNRWTLQKARELAGINAADLKPADDSSESAGDAAPCDTPAADQADTSATDTPTTDNATDCTEARETMPEAADCTTQDETPPADDAETLRAAYDTAFFSGNAQKAESKRGLWVAYTFRTADGRAGLAFKRPGHEPDFTDHATGGDRMRALQAMAQAAEQAHQQQAQQAGAAQVAAPVASPAADCTQAPETLDDCEDLSQGATLAELEQVAQRWTPEQCRQQADRLEQLNDHGGALAWRCMAAGALDLAQRVTAINAEHDRAGHLTPALASQRDAIAAQLRERLAQDCTQAHETLAAEPEAPAFQRARPQHIDLRHFLAGGVKPAQLVGLGVHYTGDMANAAGEGAIVEAQADDARGVRVAVTLQDGRHMTHLDGASFSDRPGSRFALNAKVHGAPYLAELAAARAALVASTEAAKTSKAQHHAAELVRLAAEFPHLERAESRHAGGKLAARNMRTMLKAAFPGQKFSVTSDYNCVRVRWVDGPTDAAVTAIIGRFDIGRADYNTDYFYTESSAWSELFGGVQYLFTERDESPELLARALAVFNEKYGKQATPDDWKRATGPFDYRHRDSQGMQHWFREILNATDATPPAKTARKGAKA